VLSELTSSGDRRAELEKVYLSIVRLRALLCTARALSQRGRRVEVLRAAREVFETLATSFDGAESALSRLRAFGPRWWRQRRTAVSCSSSTMKNIKARSSSGCAWEPMARCARCRSSA